MVLINGQACDSISVLDRGLNYGDGVFRTLKISNGNAIFWERHYRKLVSDCNALAIAPPTRQDFESDLRIITRAESHCVLKIIVTRGCSTRGYGAVKTAKATRVFITSSVADIPEGNYRLGVKVRLCKTRLAIQPALAGIKHLNRLENVLARSEWDNPNIAEGLMLDYDGNVIEGTMANLFVVVNNGLITPDLTRCGVAGIQRERVIEFAKVQGIQCVVRNIDVDDVLAADEMFLVNSVVGLWPVREFLDGKWDVSKLVISNNASQWLDDQDH